MAHIHLITDDDSLDELLRELFGSLRDDFTLPNGAPAKSSLLIRKSSIEREKLALREGEPPALIILDGSVRKSEIDMASPDGSPAAEFLREMRTNNAKIPAMVVSKGSLEKLEHEVLLRWDVAIWKPIPPATLDIHVQMRQEFTEILERLSNNPGKRQITVSVGRRSAKYQVFDGHYMFKIDREYKIEYQPTVLIRRMKRFSPYEQNQISENWQDELSDAGRELYSLLIEDVFGSALLDRIKRDGYGVDIRFHVEVDSGSNDSDFDDLFLLPFEATNSNMRPEGFFCARVPMARRIRRVNGGDGPAFLGNPQCLNVLLVIGAEGGDVSTTSESTGAEEGGNLAFLKHANDVCSYLEERSLEFSGVRWIKLEVLDERVAKGLQFQRELERVLTKKAFDIVHFYGHSSASSDGTFIYAPGEEEYTARAINIRAISRWIGDTQQKTRPPFLVFLSSCQSGSIRTAVEMMNAGVLSVIGFRWEVNENVAVEFVRGFYKSYIERGESIPEAYRDACAQAYALDMGQPVWASAIALVHD